MASVSFTTMREKTNKKVSEALAYHVIMERLRKVRAFHVAEGHKKGGRVFCLLLHQKL